MYCITLTNLGFVFTTAVAHKNDEGRQITQNANYYILQFIQFFLNVPYFVVYI